VADDGAQQQPDPGEAPDRADAGGAAPEHLLAEEREQDLGSSTAGRQPTETRPMPSTSGVRATKTRPSGTRATGQCRARRCAEKPPSRRSAAIAIAESTKDTESITKAPEKRASPRRTRPASSRS